MIEAIKAANKPFVPFVGADNNGFIKQLIDYKKDGLIGVAVSNSPAIGAAGLVVALDVLQKKPRDRVTTVPTAWYDNTTDENVAKLKKLYDPNVAPTDPVYGPEKDYGHFTAAQEKDCKGPANSSRSRRRSFFRRRRSLHRIASANPADRYMVRAVYVPRADASRSQ